MDAEEEEEKDVPIQADVVSEENKSQGSNSDSYTFVVGRIQN